MTKTNCVKKMGYDFDLVNTFLSNKSLTPEEQLEYLTANAKNVSKVSSDINKLLTALEYKMDKPQWQSESKIEGKAASFLVKEKKKFTNMNTLNLIKCIFNESLFSTLNELDILLTKIYDELGYFYDNLDDKIVPLTYQLGVIAWKTKNRRKFYWIGDEKDLIIVFNQLVDKGFINGNEVDLNHLGLHFTPKHRNKIPALSRTRFAKINWLTNKKELMQLFKHLITRSLIEKTPVIPITISEHFKVRNEMLDASNISDFYSKILNKGLYQPSQSLDDIFSQ
jgi:hypothetical protein